jgi:hypothetical protein
MLDLLLVVVVVVVVVVTVAGQPPAHPCSHVCCDLTHLTYCSLFSAAHTQTLRNKPEECQKIIDLGMDPSEPCGTMFENGDGECCCSAIGCRIILLMLCKL